MIEITYKCRCMAKEAVVEAPSRPAGADLLVWMEVVQACVAMDHMARSPGCLATTMEYAKIPMDEDAPELGMKPQLAS